MTRLRGGPLDGTDMELPYTINGIVDVVYTDGAEVGVAEYRVDGKFRRVVERGARVDSGRVHHPACPGVGRECLCGGGAEMWAWDCDGCDGCDDWDRGADMLALVVVGVSVVGMLYLLAQIARWAMRIGG